MDVLNVVLLLASFWVELMELKDTRTYDRTRSVLFMKNKTKTKPHTKKGGFLACRQLLFEVTAVLYTRGKHTVSTTRNKNRGDSTARTWITPWKSWATNYSRWGLKGDALWALRNEGDGSEPAPPALPHTCSVTEAPANGAGGGRWSRTPRAGKRWRNEATGATAAVPSAPSPPSPQRLPPPFERRAAAAANQRPRRGPGRPPRAEGRRGDPPCPARGSAPRARSSLLPGSPVPPRPPYHVSSPHVEKVPVHHGAVAAALLGHAELIRGVRRHLEGGGRGGGGGRRRKRLGCLRARVPPPPPLGEAAAPPPVAPLGRTGSQEGLKCGAAPGAGRDGSSALSPVPGGVRMWTNRAGGRE